MKFDSRLWKLDLDDLWWNDNRSRIKNSLIKHFRGGGGPAGLTGMKGAGKSTLAAVVAKELNTAVIRMSGDTRDIENDFTAPILIIDEAQKISEEDRQLIMSKNRHVLMVSVQNLIDDGYELFHEINPLTEEEIASYIKYHGHRNLFTDDAINEITLASRGAMRMVNLLCRTALEDIEMVDRLDIRHVATKRFKMRYGYK